VIELTGFALEVVVNLFALFRFATQEEWRKHHGLAKRGSASDPMCDVLAAKSIIGLNSDGVLGQARHRAMPAAQGTDGGTASGSQIAGIELENVDFDLVDFAQTIHCIFVPEGDTFNYT